MHNVMFATEVGQCRSAFLKDNEGKPSLDKLRKLLSDFAIVGKNIELSGGGLVDIGRTGIVKGLTEQTEYILSQSGTVDLGQLGGTQKAAPSSKKKSSARQQAASQALNSLLGRSQVDVAATVDAAMTANISVRDHDQVHQNTSVPEVAFIEMEDDVADIEGSETDFDITDAMDNHDDDGERLVESDHEMQPPTPEEEEFVSLKCIECGAINDVLLKRANA